MTGRPRKLQKAAGTRTGFEALKSGFRPPRPQATRSDIVAIDRGEGRVVACLFRGFEPKYPQRFIFRALDLLPGGVRLRPYWFSPSRQVIEVAEPIRGVHQRPRNPETDQRIRSAGNYRPGGSLGSSGFSVVVGETDSGPLEFAVPNPDVPLLVHYIERLIAATSNSELGKNYLLPAEAVCWQSLDSGHSES